MSGWSDQDCLRALDLTDNQGLGRAAVAEALGVSRGAVIGVLHRINTETDMAEAAPFMTPDATAARKPENRDGGMPRHWWRDGLRKRGVNV